MHPSTSGIKVTPLRVLSNTEIIPGVFYLTVEKKIRFSAGQTVAVTLVPDEPPRLYSIASGEQEPFVGILFQVVPGGSLTPRLARLQRGSRVYVSEAFGSFTGDEQPACWIATGTGIAPFHSMVKSGLTQNKVLVHGAKKHPGFYFQDTFQQVFADNYYRCASQEPDTNFFKGRVTDFLLQQKAPLPEKKYYLCGQAEMVVEIRDILIGKGVSFDRIHAEIYF